MNRNLLILFGLALSLGLAACGETTPSPNVEETVATAVAATIAAQSVLAQSNVETAEATPYPTYTPYPSPTRPSPTAPATTEPTEEPIATSAAALTSTVTVSATVVPTQPV